MGALLVEPWPTTRALTIVASFGRRYSISTTHTHSSGCRSQISAHVRVGEIVRSGFSAVATYPSSSRRRPGQVLDLSSRSLRPTAGDRSAGQRRDSMFDAAARRRVALRRFRTTVAFSQLIATGLAVVAASTLPASFNDAAFGEALGQVVAAATRHLDVIKRVAQVSRRAHVENRELRADLDRLGHHGEGIARSAAMRAVLTRAELVARHPTTVLLSGTFTLLLVRAAQFRLCRCHSRRTRDPTARAPISNARFVARHDDG